MTARTTARAFADAVAATLSSASPALAQLRVVSLNGYNLHPLDPYPRSPWADRILQAIGTSVSDDPFIVGNSGIVRPIDVLALQETHSWDTTVAGYRDIMNALYSGANYQIDTKHRRVHRRLSRPPVRFSDAAEPDGKFGRTSRGHKHLARLK